MKDSGINGNNGNNETNEINETNDNKKKTKKNHKTLIITLVVIVVIISSLAFVYKSIMDGYELAEKTMHSHSVTADDIKPYSGFMDDENYESGGVDGFVDEGTCYESDNPITEWAMENYLERYEVTCYKPAIYLYPETETTVEVKIDETYTKLKTTYPKYNDGWKVVAHPDGKIINTADNREYDYLFWDGKSEYKPDFTKGFCIKGTDTEEFLKDKLDKIGLTVDESNEFIVYWLPLMDGNKYNLISFQWENYDNAAKLNINPEPDSILRVMMAYKPLTEYVEIEEQEFEHFERTGFTVVEWGGTIVE